MPRLHLVFVSVIIAMSCSVLSDLASATSTKHSNNAKSKKPVSKSCIRRATYTYSETTNYGYDYSEDRKYLVNSCSYAISVKYRCINAGFASADILNGQSLNLKPHHKMRIDGYEKCTFSQAPFRELGDDGDSDGPE